MIMEKEMTKWEGWLSLLFYVYFLGALFTCCERSTRCDRRDAAAGPEKVCQRPRSAASLIGTQLGVTS